MLRGSPFYLSVNSKEITSLVLSLVDSYSGLQLWRWELDETNIFLVLLLNS